MTVTILTGLIAILLGVLVGKVTNNSKIDKIYEKLIRVEVELENLGAMGTKLDDHSQRIRDIENDIGIIKNKLKIK